MAKIGADIGVFRKLAALQPGKSKTVDQLAGETGADAELLGKYHNSVIFCNDIEAKIVFRAHSSLSCFHKLCPGGRPG
jgi:hypothetical protein